ncbi:MAG: LON peptidase substrate-binding domain-containing protein [Candidatus Acidiferrales bacterium]|jgi:Lon protease-like protein
MAKPDRIPLFPLDVVLLPAMMLPLHIFEPRYKTMIRHCLGEQMEFGMVLASDQSMAKIGCTAAIERITKEYPDGRMDILTEGRSAFRLAEVLDESQYYEGLVEYLAEEPSELNPAKEAELVQLGGQCHVLLFGRPWEEGQPRDATTLAYRMAARLPMELARRQKLLEMRKEEDRREFLLEWLTRLLPQLNDRERKRQRATGNGHGLN